MNPLPMLVADLRALRWTAWVIICLVALAVGIGVTVSAQERTFRKSSAAATEDFDLLIGAPGSQTQLLLTSVFLQPDAVPLMDGAVLRKIQADRRVKAAAPIAAGDSSNGYPVVGTSSGFVTRWGRITLSEGRTFARTFEAVVGADVAMALDSEFAPSHGHPGRPLTPGHTHPDEAQSRHEAKYTIVGRMPRLGTPWDRAILVPIASVWSLHQRLPAQDTEQRSTPDHPAETDFEAFDRLKTLPGIPAIVVKPMSIAEAYALRGSYRQGGTMAFFPAEVLVQLYGMTGDLRDLLVAATFLNALLMFAAIILLLLAVINLRRRRYAVLRALGAPRRYVFLLVWLNAAVLLTAGCIAGLLLGWGLTWGIAHALQQSTGISARFVFDLTDILPILLELTGASLLALIPAALAYTAPIAESLRS